MVTGDDVITGAAIAKQVGIDGEAILGADFAALPEAERLARIDGIGVVESLNGGSSDEENAHALHFAAEHGLRGVGGSDSHFVSGIARWLESEEKRLRAAEAEGGAAEAASGASSACPGRADQLSSY